MCVTKENLLHYGLGSRFFFLANPWSWLGLTKSQSGAYVLFQKPVVILICEAKELPQNNNKTLLYAVLRSRIYLTKTEVTINVLSGVSKLTFWKGYKELNRKLRKQGGMTYYLTN